MQNRLAADTPDDNQHRIPGGSKNRLPGTQTAGRNDYTKHRESTAFSGIVKTYDQFSVKICEERKHWARDLQLLIEHRVEG